VEEAKLWNRRVAAHAHGTEAIKMAIRAGVASIEHGSFIDDEAISLMKERGTWLVSDIYNGNLTKYVCCDRYQIMCSCMRCICI
jgi:imidazolonepropionase-like amidohydrolase